MEKQQKKWQRLLIAGGEIAGGAVGGALGFFAGGPFAAAGAGAAGSIFSKTATKLLSDYASRALSQREIVRVGAAAALAVDKISERMDQGDMPRQDGFFERGVGQRSSAEEIFEGVLQKSKNEHEERKARFYANIFATAAFDNRFTAESLNHFLSLAERLTYRQLCILQVFSSPHKFHLFDEEYTLNYLKTVSFEKMAVLHEMYDLYQLRLLKCQSPGDGEPDDYMSFDQIHPTWMFPNDVGENLRHLMQLQTISQDDLGNVASFFKE
jgi:hypothetical protein